MLLYPTIKQMHTDHSTIPDVQTSVPFFAAGISLVTHPRSTHAPAVHANYRFLEITEQPTEGEQAQGKLGKLIAWWFGAGRTSRRRTRTRTTRRTSTRRSRTGAILTARTCTPRSRSGATGTSSSHQVLRRVAWVGEILL